MTINYNCWVSYSWDCTVTRIVHPPTALSPAHWRSLSPPPASWDYRCASIMPGLSSAGDRTKDFLSVRQTFYQVKLHLGHLASMSSWACGRDVYFFCFCCWVTIHYVDKWHLACPSITWWSLSIFFLLFGWYKQCCYEHLGTDVHISACGVPF